MKHWILSTAIALATLTVNAQTPAKWKLKDLQQQIQESHGPVLINFWATFCVPCVHELPYFQEMQQKYPGLKVIIVSLDLPDVYPTGIEKFLKKKEISLQSAWLAETDADLFCPVVSKDWSGSIPASVFINNDKGYKKFFEKEFKKEELEAEVLKLMETAP